MQERPRVRLMSDYGVVLPLWGEDGLLDPGSSGVSPELEARLLAWQEAFDRDFHWDRGWRGAAEARAYAAGGRTLLRMLEREIGWRADVVLDLWPVPTSRR